MQECIFCKIISGRLPAHKVWEDKNFLAFLSIYPNTPGVTVLASKKHISSNILEAPEEDFLGLMKAARKVAGILANKLKVGWVGIVVEGTAVPHLHAKLYPLHGLDKGEHLQQGQEIKTIFFKSYPGYITTQEGKRMAEGELRKIAEKITRP